MCTIALLEVVWNNWCSFCISYHHRWRS